MLGSAGTCISFVVHVALSARVRPNDAWAVLASEVVPSAWVVLVDA